MDDLLAPYLAHPRVVALGNLLISLIVLTWTLGIRNRDRDAWVGWVGFWIGTSAFYVCLTVSPAWEGLPFAALYVATWFLLSAYVRTLQVRKARLLAGIVVGIAVLVDVTLSQLDREPALHQLVAGATLMLWAWRIRDSASESVALIAYALVQLPLHSMFEIARAFSGPLPATAVAPDYDGFIAASYVAYLLLKLALIAAITVAVKGGRVE